MRQKNDYISHIHIFIQVRSITFHTKCDLKKGNDSLNLICESGRCNSPIYVVGGRR